MDVYHYSASSNISKASVVSFSTKLYLIGQYLVDSRDGSCVIYISGIALFTIKLN